MLKKILPGNYVYKINNQTYVITHNGYYWNIHNSRFNAQIGQTANLNLATQLIQKLQN